MSKLMKPLGSDDLKPRSFAQAAESPQPPIPVQAEAPAEAQSEDLPESPAVSFAPETEAQEPAVPEAASAEEDLLADFALEQDEDDEEPDAPDAMPSEQMPEPAFVPLCEWDEPAKQKKRRGWLWLLVLTAIAAGGYALWHEGLADKIWLFIVDKTAAIRYNLSIFIQSFKSPLS